MNVDDIVFNDYVICPLCKNRLRAISGSQLIHKHGYSWMKEFKLEFGIPMQVALISKNTRAIMCKKGNLRSDWFKENVMIKGIEYARNSYDKKIDLVPKEIRVHAGMQRKGEPQDWLIKHIAEMKQKGWLDLHKATVLLGVSYNYTRKCATDGRLKIILEKGIRFTKVEWINDTIKLLQENRIKSDLHRQQFGGLRKKMCQK